MWKVVTAVRLTAALVIAFGIGTRAGAQAILRLECRSGGAALPLLSGALIAESVGLDLERDLTLQRVAPTPAACLFRSRVDGQFQIGGLPPGSYRLEVLPSGIQRLAPVLFELGADSSVHFVLPIREENRVVDCLELSQCASILVRPSLTERTASADMALELISYRLALALAHFEAPPSEWYACVNARLDVLSSLREIYPRVVSALDCDTLETPRGGPSLMRHRATGVIAMAVGLGSGANSSSRPPAVRTAATTATVRVWVSHGQRSSVGFECVVERREEMWIPRICRSGGAA
jgi:hypothetical protein